MANGSGASDTMYFVGFGLILAGIVFDIFALTLGGMAAVVGGVFLDIWAGD